jgi:hypothetical protein
VYNSKADHKFPTSEKNLHTRTTCTSGYPEINLGGLKRESKGVIFTLTGHHHKPHSKFHGNDRVGGKWGLGTFAK